MIADNRPQKSGGQGETTITLGSRDGEERGDMKMIKRALAEGWLKPWQCDPRLLDELPTLAAESLARSRGKGDERGVMRAIEAIRGFQADNLKLAATVDHVERLDADEATENMGIRIEVEHVEQGPLIEDG